MQHMVASQFGMFLIGEGISDCIDGIEGMVTGEFSWVEWAITKAAGIALSLLTGGVLKFFCSICYKVLWKRSIFICTCKVCTLYNVYWSLRI